MRILFRALLLSALFLVYSEPSQAWTPYFELGTSLGKLSSYDQYFSLASTGSTSNMGFCGGLSFYMPVTSPANFFHFELGLQNRMYFVSNSSPQMDLAMTSTNIAMRFELYRFYVGGGYSPINLASTSGPLKLHTNSNVTSFFLEGGLIWRVVPELQIALTYAREYGIIPGGGAHSPTPGTEYGLRFRFPLSPYATVGDASSKFDGFRYPFGFMK